jgi:hypothetical protein
MNEYLLNFASSFMLLSEGSVSPSGKYPDD